MPSPSFWTSNPMVPTWSSHLQSWWSSSPPRILESRTTSHIPLRQVLGTLVVEATPSTAAELSDFWERWFSPSKSSRCCMPAAHIQKALSEKRWVSFLCRRSDTGALIATIVRRRVKGLRVKQARWPEAGIVDFFCVHPAWRRKGVGRLLLGVLERHETSERSGPPPHLILWEGLHLSVPPLSIGGLWMTRCSVKQGESVKGCVGGQALWALLLLDARSPQSSMNLQKQLCGYFHLVALLSGIHFIAVFQMVRIFAWYLHTLPKRPWRSMHEVRWLRELFC